MRSRPVIVVAVGLTALGCGTWIIGNGAPRDHRLLLSILTAGAGLALGRFAVPPALAALRRLAGLTSRLADQWCGVPILDRDRPPTLRRSAQPGFAGRRSP